MSDLLCIATIVLTALTQASLQLSLGALILLYHASLSRHRRKRTRYLAKGYIWGATSISFLMLTSFAFLIKAIFGSSLSLLGVLIAAGALASSGIAMRLLYYRKGEQHTELWLPRNFSRYVTRRAKSADDIIESFSLGSLSILAEFPFSFMLYLVAANAVMQMSAVWQLPAILLYVACSSFPLFSLRHNVKNGKNAIDIQRWRLKNRNFIRDLASGSFFVLALFIVGFWA